MSSPMAYSTVEELHQWPVWHDISFCDDQLLWHNLSNAYFSSEYNFMHIFSEMGIMFIYNNMQAHNLSEGL